MSNVVPTMPGRLSFLPEFKVQPARPLPDGHYAVCVVHAPEQCAGTPCALHDPSDHKLKDAPWFLTPTSVGWLVVRVCEHGNEHIDPDSLARIRGQIDTSGHCICGCCDGLS